MSIAVRVALAAELRRMRLASGRSQADVANSGIAVVETIRSIERAERQIKPNYVKQLCELYGADAATTARLIEMAKNNQKGWWESPSYSGGSVRDPKFPFFLRAESTAATVRTYDSELLYGLLQTTAYHRAVYNADPTLPPKNLDEEVRFRQDRQEATLGRTPPLKIDTVLNEAVLARRFSCMDEQREHLLELNRRPHVKISVLPWDAGPHAAMSGSFKIATLATGIPDLLFLETASGVRYTEEVAVTKEYGVKFRSARAQAIPIEEYLQS